MNSATVSIGVIFNGYEGRDSRITITGHPGDDAVAALEDAVCAGLGYDVSSYGREAGRSVFVMSSTHEEDNDPLGWDYLHLPARVTFDEMRLVVGPRNFDVRVRFSGFGGDGIFDGFFVWTVADAVSFGRDALEIYGAVEVVRRLGRTIRRRKWRERRESADDWLHNGGPGPDVLRNAVERQHSWSDEEIKTALRN